MNQEDAKTVRSLSSNGTDFTIHQPSFNHEATQQEIDYLGRGMATYRFFMGSQEQQKLFFSKIIRWDRCLFIKSGNDVIGCLTYYFDGLGPYKASWKAFNDEYGYIRGSIKSLIYKLLERRCIRSECYIGQLFVSYKFRNNGLATNLVETLLSYLQSSGVDEVELEVYKKNHVAVSFYERLGFNCYKSFNIPLISRKFPDSVVLRMRKNLQGS